MKVRHTDLVGEMIFVAMIVLALFIVAVAR